MHQPLPHHHNVSSPCSHLIASLEDPVEAHTAVVLNEHMKPHASFAVENGDDAVVDVRLEFVVGEEEIKARGSAARIRLRVD